MTGTAITVLGLAAWTLLLLLLIAAMRVKLTVSGEKRANSFKPTGEDMTPFGQRLTRAHANCYEHLPIALALLLYAMQTGNTSMTDATGPVFLAARIAQTAVHLYSVRNRYVTIRFGFFVVQVLLMALWIAALAFG
ncbi:MAG: MAPEG family protein [Rhizobiaceae bacterium]